jgi:hypothetical protein
MFNFSDANFLIVSFAQKCKIFFCNEIVIINDDYLRIKDIPKEHLEGFKEK